MCNFTHENRVRITEGYGYIVTFTFAKNGLGDFLVIIFKCFLISKCFTFTMQINLCLC